jgi:hypothetical protein
VAVVNALRHTSCWILVASANVLKVSDATAIDRRWSVPTDLLLSSARPWDHHQQCRGSIPRHLRGPIRLVVMLGQTSCCGVCSSLDRQGLT